MNILKGIEKKKPFKSYDLKGFNQICFSARGERGIRTPGPVTVNSFQDCRNRPLCHFSNKSHAIANAVANITTFFPFAKTIWVKFYDIFNFVLRFV